MSYPSDGIMEEVRELARHWGPDTSPMEFAEFIGHAVLARVYADLHSRQDLVRWERKIRRDERDRLVKEGYRKI